MSKKTRCIGVVVKATDQQYATLLNQIDQLVTLVEGQIFGEGPLTAGEIAAGWEPIDWDLYIDNQVV